MPYANKEDRRKYLKAWKSKNIEKVREYNRLHAGKYNAIRKANNLLKKEIKARSKEDELVGLMEFPDDSDFVEDETFLNELNDY